MYWCKYSKQLTVFLLAVAGCRPAVKNDKLQTKYFDIKKYFSAEAARLTKQYPRILKTVSYNGQQETKQINIKHWQQELNLFIESDINKPAWRNSYAIVTTDTGITYTTVDTTLHTQQISITLKDKKVTGIHIINLTQNMLYQTKENLFYHPDSIYTIKKYQTVKLLGSNDYQITGKF